METKTEPKIDQMLDLMLDYKPLRDDVVLQLPTKSEREALAKTKTGLHVTNDLKKVENNYFFTVIATGDACKEITVGDKIIIRLGVPIGVIQINGVEFGQVSEFQIAGKALKK